MSTPAKSWRDVLPVHPAADLLPMMSPDEQRALGEDILKNGMVVPIVLWEAKKGAPLTLLDGRNRFDGLEAVGWPVLDQEGKWLRSCIPVNIVSGSDPYAYVLSYNERRRHLTAEQRRELIANVLKAQPEKSNRQIAALAKADDKTVAAVRGQLEATAEIPQLSKTVGKDGKARATKKQLVDPKAARRAQRIAEDAEARSRQHAVQREQEAAAMVLAPPALVKEIENPLRPTPDHTALAVDEQEIQAKQIAVTLKTRYGDAPLRTVEAIEWNPLVQFFIKAGASAEQRAEANNQEAQASRNSTT